MKNELFAMVREEQFQFDSMGCGAAWSFTIIAHGNVYYYDNGFVQQASQRALRTMRHLAPRIYANFSFNYVRGNDDFNLNF